MEIDNECRNNVIKILSKILDEQLAKKIENSIFNFIKRIEKEPSLEATQNP